MATIQDTKPEEDTQGEIQEILKIFDRLKEMHEAESRLPPETTTSDGQSRITDPMYWPTFRKVKVYRDLAKKASENPRDKAFLAAIEGRQNELDDIIARDSLDKDAVAPTLQEWVNSRVFIQSEKNAAGEMTAKRILLGRYDDSKRITNLVVLHGEEPKYAPLQVHVTSIIDLETRQKTDIPQLDGNFVIPGSNGVRGKVSVLLVPLSDEGNLTQTGANDLTDWLRSLPKLDVAKPNKTSDGKTMIEGPLTFDAFKKPDLLKSILPVTPKDTEPPLTHALLQTDTDPATGKITRRILLGHINDPAPPMPNEPYALDPTKHLLTGEPMHTIKLTKSFNVENGETSDLRNPIEFQISEEKKISQYAVNDVAKKVQEAVEKKEISMLAPKGGNPHFDRLLAQGHSGKVQYGDGNGVAAQTTPTLGDHDKAVSPT